MTKIWQQKWTHNRVPLVRQTASATHLSFLSSSSNPEVTSQRPPTTPLVSKPSIKVLISAKEWLPWFWGGLKRIHHFDPHSGSMYVARPSLSICIQCLPPFVVAKPHRSSPTGNWSSGGQNFKPSVSLQASISLLKEEGRTPLRPRGNDKALSTGLDSLRLASNNCLKVPLRVWRL